MTDGLSAPRLAFTRCPPGFQQLRQVALPPGLRPSRAAVAPLRLTIPPRPPRPVRLSLGMRLREAWQAAMPRELGGCRSLALGQPRH